MSVTVLLLAAALADAAPACVDMGALPPRAEWVTAGSLAEVRKAALAGVLYYGVAQVGYNLAGRGNSFYADRAVDDRLHPFPVYCQSIIARNAWKGAVEAGARDNPDHLDGAEWYGMGVGRKYNGYLWSNQFTRPVSESRELGGKMRGLPALDSGASYDPSLDFMDWKASTESYVASSQDNWNNDGNGDYRVKTTSIFHGIVEENFLKYDIEGNPRPATGDSPGAYVRMTE